MPLALGLHEMGERKVRWLVTGAAWLMQARLGEFTCCFSVLVGLWLAWSALSRTDAGV
jgi:hypothetical protein